MQHKYHRADEILRTQLRNVELNPDSNRKSLILNNMACNALEVMDLNQALGFFDMLNELIIEGQISEEFNEALFYRNYGHFLHFLALVS